MAERPLAIECVSPMRQLLRQWLCDSHWSDQRHALRRRGMEAFPAQQGALDFARSMRAMRRID